MNEYFCCHWFLEAGSISFTYWSLLLFQRLRCLFLSLTISSRTHSKPSRCRCRRCCHCCSCRRCRHCCRCCCRCCCRRCCRLPPLHLNQDCFFRIAFQSKLFSIGSASSRESRHGFSHYRPILINSCIRRSDIIRQIDSSAASSAAAAAAAAAAPAEA